MDSYKIDPVCIVIIISQNKLIINGAMLVAMHALCKKFCMSRE